MKKDQGKADKFLELLPDKAMEMIFHSLFVNRMIRQEDAYLMDDYLKYIRVLNLSFENETLQKNHDDFHQAFDELDTFTMGHFFPNNPHNNIYVLYDFEFKRKYPETYEKRKSELEALVNKAEDKYSIFRRSLEGYLLTNNPDDNESVNTRKKKRTTFPEFPRTEWSRVSMRFIDERNAVLSDSKETKPLVPESIGCIDGRNQKADKAWGFLVDLAKREGITPRVDKKERERQKKDKQKITDILRTIFKNQTDPFEAMGGGSYKALFKIEFIKEEAKTDRLEDKYGDIKDMYTEMTEE